MNLREIIMREQMKNVSILLSNKEGELNKERIMNENVKKEYKMLQNINKELRKRI